MKRGNLLNGLLGYWGFDDASDSVVQDRSGNGNNGVWNGTLGSQWTTSGKLTGAGVFNGTNNYVLAPDTQLPAGASPRTLSIWVKTTQAFDTSYHTFMAYGAIGVTNQAQTINLNTAGAWGMSQWGSGVTATKVINDGTWHHLLYTYDGSLYRLYSDGLPDSTGSPTPATVVAGRSLWIGYGSSPSQANYVAATLDEVGIWGRALTKAEVTQLYNCGVGYNPCGPV